MNKIADNFFDVLNELITVDKTNAVGETMNSESRDRPSIDNMTERQYNNFGWVTVNNVMSYEEYGSLMHQFDDFKNRKHSYPTTENGEALIIAYDNEHNATKLAGIKGTTANPTISFVIESASDGHYDNYYLEVLRDDAKNILKNRYAYESLQGEDVFRYIGREDYPTFSELKKQRRSSEKGRKNSESFLYGSGSGGENSETGYVSNEPSSTDGGFSMPDNQNYSTIRNTNDMRFHNLRYIEKVAEVSADALTGKTSSGGSATSATDYSVADLYDFVKRNDKEFTPGKSVNKSFLNSDGTPKVFYHGTPNGTFTEFRDWQYFTQNKDYAGNYLNQGASSNGYKKTASNPKIYESYLTAKKVFDTRRADAKKIFDEEFYGKWGNGTPLSDRGLPDWTDGDDLIEFLEEKGYDYDAIILDEGGTGGYGDNVLDRGLSYVIKDSSQIKSATDNIGTFSNSKDINYSTKRNATDKDNAESELANKAFEVNRRASQLRAKRDEIMRTDEYKTAINQGDDDIDNFIKRYADYLKSSGLDKVNSDLAKAEKEYENLKKQLNEMYNNRVASEEAAAIKASGGDRAEYFRKSAVKEFGYTPYFYDAGYVLPNGKMLNFSGEKGKHYGSRGQDHRGISTIYANLDGTAAMNDFINMGNIRIMAESPGIDISSSAAPTAEQYALIRRFAKEIGRQKGYFGVDFSDENGRSAGNYEYEGSINPDRIINDIKYFFENGVTREQSVTSQFHYSKSREAEYMTAAESGDTETAQRMVDEAAKAAGYTERLYHQTDNDFSVFDTKHQGAGSRDNETPYGIFMKKSDKNIGLKGSKQMPLFAKITNPLIAENREDLVYKLRKISVEYSEIKDKLSSLDNEYQEKFDGAKNAWRDYLTEYRKDHPNESRREIYNDKTFNELFDAEDKIVDEWTTEATKLDKQAKEIITKELIANGYDGVIISQDVGSFGRETDTYIALNSSQVKSADPVTYDDSGNIIPLSERFNEQNDDIRYSVKRSTEGFKYVEIEDDILISNGETLAQTLSDIISNKFNKLIEANGQQIKVNADTKSEWRYSKDASTLLKRDKTAYYNKMRAFNNADELVRTAKDWINEKAKHKNYRQFARGFVNFEYQGNGYSAEVVVGISKSGSATLYDLVNIQDKKITELQHSNAGANLTAKKNTSVTKSGSSVYANNVTALSQKSQDFSEKREQSNLSTYELSEFVSMSDELLEQKRIAEANANELNNLTEFPARKLNQNDIASVVKSLWGGLKTNISNAEQKALITELYEYIANDKDVTSDEIYRRAYTIAEKVFKNASISTRDEYDDLVNTYGFRPGNPFA